MENSDVCGNPRHASIAFAFNGTNIRCPLCELLDAEERRRDWYKQLTVAIDNLKAILDSEEIE